MKRIEKLLDIMDQLDEWKVLLSIFGISLIIRVLYVVLMPTTVFGDALHYNGVAIGLIEGKGYEGGVGSFNPPGLPFFLAVIYYVFGYNPQIACVFQAIISSLTCVIIYYIGKTVLNKKIGILSALITAFYPIFIIYSSFLMIETLFIFLLCLSIFYLLKVHEQPTAKNLLISGILLGLTTLTRNVIIIFTPFILIWMLWSSKERKKIFLRFAAVFVIMMVVVSPWTIRNYKVHHEFVLVSPNDGVNLWMGNNPDANGKPPDYPNNIKYLNISNQVQRNNICREKAFEFIRKNPSEFLILGAKKFAHFWGFLLPFFNCYLYDYFIHPIPSWLFMVLAPLTVLPYALVLPLAIFGIIFYQKWDKKASLLLLLIFYYVILHSVVIASTRYHMPVVPFLIIFAAYGASSINRVRSEIKYGDVNTKRKIILFFTTIAILIASWYYSTFCYYSDGISAVIGKLIGG
jgi:4-amino-4-deoxy-L-arabinose transferase-like glycosyltransferase